MRIFHNVTEADRRLWKAPLVSQLFPFLWAEPHHADVSLFCDSRSWQNDHSTSRSRINCVGRSLSCRKGHGVQSPWLAVSQTYLSAFHYTFELAIELTLYRSLEVRRFHIITPPFRYDVKSVYPSFRTISVR